MKKFAKWLFNFGLIIMIVLTIKIIDPKLPKLLKSPFSPNTDATEVYENAIRAVMWIVNPDIINTGSGVLLDKKNKLAVTNAHVTSGMQIVHVYFPAPNASGKLMGNRDFYVNNRDVLEQLGYFTEGYVQAENAETDLAIIRLAGLPETARQVDWGSSTPSMNTGDGVYILGNPAGRDLWRWNLGEIQNDSGKFLHIQASVYGGNSGGPVLNKQGTLLGIIARSDELMNASAIPARYIHQLLPKSNVKNSGSRR